MESALRNAPDGESDAVPHRRPYGVDFRSLDPSAAPPERPRRRQRHQGYEDEETALCPLEHDLAEIENSSSDRGIRTSRSVNQLVVVKEETLSGQLQQRNTSPTQKNNLREADPRLID